MQSMFISGRRKMQQRGEYLMPIQIFDDAHFTPDDALLLDIMFEHTPRTNLKPGNIVQLTDVPPHLRRGLRVQGMEGHLPAFWKVRYVISRWAFTVLRHYNDPNHFHRDGEPPSPDYIISEVENELDPIHFRTPVVYAHSFPHGMYPDSAQFFFERHCRRININDGQPQELVEWPVVLDEAHARFRGYDTTQYVTGFHLDLAPDHYSEGECLGKPLDHESAAFDTACVLGLEEKMVRPVPTRLIGSPYWLDPEHDAYAE